MEMELIDGRSVHFGSFKRAEGPSACSPVGYYTFDERSLADTIRGCCMKFSFKLIDEIKLHMRKCERQAYMCQRESDPPRTGDRVPWIGQPLGDCSDEVCENDSEDLGIKDDDDDDRNGDDSVGEGHYTHGGFSTPSVVGNAHLQNLAASEEVATGRTYKGNPNSVHAGMKGIMSDGTQNSKSSADSFKTWHSCPVTPSRVLGDLSRDALLRVSTPSQQIGDVLRGARQSMLPRQNAATNLKLRLVYLCWGNDGKIREDTLDFSMGVLVIVNLAQMGVSADCARDWSGWLAVDCLFAVSFLIEFMLKIHIRGIYNHFIVYWQGTLFDGVIVLSALVEMVCDLFIGANLGTGVQSFTILRVVRLLRLARIVKAFRLPMFKDIQQMCEGLMTDSQTLFWSMILLMVPIYSSALLLRETVGEDTANKDIVKPFTSLPWSFFTTFRCIMGDCAADSGQPLPELLVQKLRFGWIFGFFYVGLILITFLGVFNVIIAVYVEQIVTSAKKNESLQRRRRLGNAKRMDLLFGNLIRVFVSAKMNDQYELGFHPSGTAGKSDTPHLQALDAEEIAKIEITKEFFDRTMDTEDVQNILEQLAIPSEDRWDLFDILDADGSGHLELGEIVGGLKKLRGEPRRSDAVSVGLIVRSLQRRLHSETQLIFSSAMRIADNVELIRQDHREHRDTILDKFDALAELWSGAGKVPDTYCDRNVVPSEYVAQRQAKRTVLV